jgi:group I intron endonuclease
MIVYLLFNRRNCKCYVGITSQRRCRWNKNLSNKTNSHFRNAISKYGPKAFIPATLARCDTIREANRLEKFWIKVLQSDNPRFGYNMQKGGAAWAAEHTPEVRKLISQMNLLRWRRTSERARKKFIRTMQRVWAERTDAERARIGAKIRKKKEHKRVPDYVREKISNSMLQYWARKRLGRQNPS